MEFNELSDIFEMKIPVEKPNNPLIPMFVKNECQLCGWSFSQRVSGSFAPGELESISTFSHRKKWDHILLKHCLLVGLNDKSN